MPLEVAYTGQVLMPRQFRIRTVLLTLAMAIGGCATTTDTREVRPANAAPDKPPVSEQSTALRQPETPYRTVVHGDTLYSIAWEAGRDYRELANWNRISPPYTIKLGQQLRVIPLVVEKTVAPPPAKPAAKNKTTSAAAGKVSAPTAKAAPATAATPKPVTKKTKTESGKSPDSGKTGARTGDWMWPADGQILKRYSDNDASKGLDIGGARGQPVRATANGRVVYQGSGLRGYGQLIIVKHSDEFLSAYAHNDRIYVKEGDVVKRGQKIADMGSTGTDRVKLHFEIRRQGTPIDPLKYLPKR